jgi:hypothetical protein
LGALTEDISEVTMGRSALAKIASLGGCRIATVGKFLALDIALGFGFVLHSHSSP